MIYFLFFRLGYMGVTRGGRSYLNFGLNVDPNCMQCARRAMQVSGYEAQIAIEKRRIR